MKAKLLSRVRLLATPWTADYQAPPTMEFSRQEYGSGVPLPSFSLLPAVASRDESKLLPHVSTDFSVRFLSLPRGHRTRNGCLL